MKVKPQGFLLAISIGVARLRMRPRPRICLLPAARSDRDAWARVEQVKADKSKSCRLKTPDCARHPKGSTFAAAIPSESV